MKEVIDYIGKEWATLSNAPLTFVTLFVLALGVAFVVSKLYYAGRIETLKEKAEVLKERLSAKDDQISEYRERLHLVPTDNTTYSLLANEELKKKALDVVENIRSFIGDRRNIESKLFNRQYTNLSEEEIHQRWEMETQNIIAVSSETQSKYNELFKTDTILLRDEISSRLPKEFTNSTYSHMYEYPTNLLGIEEVVTNLELLAKNLPIKLQLKKLVLNKRL